MWYWSCANSSAPMAATSLCAFTLHQQQHHSPGLIPTNSTPPFRFRFRAHNAYGIDSSSALISFGRPSVRGGLGGTNKCCESAAKTTTAEGLKLRFRISEAASDQALEAAANLRVRTFYDFKQSYGVENHRRYMSGLEFEALKERIAGERLGFKRVTCVIATVDASKNLPDDLCSLCTVILDDKEQVVVGSLDLNQSNYLPDEISGSRPAGFAADFSRAYLTNVCVAQELHRNGIGTSLIFEAVKIAYHWGMTDLYVHVAVDNDSARYLYEKVGFVYESAEPAWQARFLGRPRRILLWAGVKSLLSQLNISLD